MENITYEEFIQNILDTRGRFACGDEYHERHHIVPKCIGGGNEKENLIDLYAREHFEAHRLLALENSNVKELIYAWWCMSTTKNEYTKQRYKISATEYEEVKNIHSNMLSKRMNGVNNPNYGKPCGEIKKINISNALKGKYIGENNPNYGNHKLSGENNPMFGKHHSEEIRKK